MLACSSPPAELLATRVSSRLDMLELRWDRLRDPEAAALAADVEGGAGDGEQGAAGSGRVERDRRRPPPVPAASLLP